MILHITNDYSGSKVYRNLISELDELGFKQLIYNPIRSNVKPDNNLNFIESSSKVHYRNILNSNVDRLFYKQKIKKIVKDIESIVDFSSIKCIHAHTWFSDGGVAFELSKKYNIPYIITVRNTDINVFLKYKVLNLNYGIEIVLNAKKIIVISASYKNRLMNMNKLLKIKNKIEKDLFIIPNGIEKFWIENIKNKVSSIKNEVFNIVFIGKFQNTKNVINLQKAIVKLNENKYRCHLFLIGKGGNKEKEMKRMVKNNENIFTYLGFISDKNELKKVLSLCHIFAMPSKYETFGLVYVEALLQGLPILYTKGEGIDGFYDNSIGEAVDNMSTNEIAKKLDILMRNYEKYNFNQKLISENHNWKNIALKYKDIYKFLN
jgi:glycosyltransferase involved in cell wall biosynthesis